MFVGRVREMREVGELLSRYRVVTITGPPGVGKTRLAIEAARRFHDRFPGGVRLADLSPLGRLDSVGLRVAEALLGDGPGVAEWNPRALADVIGDAAILLVLDNCEHMVEGCARIASGLLAHAPTLRILATSQEPLRIDGESVYRARPMEPEDSFRLFVERTKARSPGFVPIGEARVHVQELCSRLEGLPLAIELAAARAGLLSPAELVPLLADRFDVLTSGARDSPDRHRTLRAALDWSYSLLDPGEQRLFRRLSVFAGSFDLHAATALGGDDVITLLGSLVDRSIVQRTTPEADRARFRLLETMREYALQRLTAVGELDDARSAHLAHYVERAESTFMDQFAGRSDQLHALDQDLDNLRAAVVWSLTAAPHAGLRVVGAARDTWFMSAQGDGLRFAEDLLTACPEEGEYRTRALLLAGVLANTLQRHEDAREHLQEAHRASRQQGRVEQQAWAAYFLGVEAVHTQDLETGERWLDTCVDLFERTGDRVGITRATGYRGALHLLRGDWAAARTTLKEGVAASGAVDDQWGLGFCATYLGITETRAGDRPAANRHLLTAVRALAPLGEVTVLPITLIGLALNAPASDRRRAVRVVAAAASIRTCFGGGFPPWLVEPIDRFAATSTAELGREAFDMEWQAGRRLGLEGVVAEVVGREPKPRRARGAELLSERELEVARLVAEGFANRAIADRLHLSHRTVENHVFHVLSKLGLDNRTQIAAWLLTAGIE